MLIGHLYLFFSKQHVHGDFPGGPVVKSLPSNEGSVNLIPPWGTKNPHALWLKNQNIEQKQYCSKFNKDLDKNKQHVLCLFTELKVAFPLYIFILLHSVHTCNCFMKSDLGFFNQVSVLIKVPLRDPCILFPRSFSFPGSQVVHLFPYQTLISNVTYGSLFHLNANASRSVVSNSLQPHGLQPTRLPMSILQARILEWVAIHFSTGSS